jgi:hypothetical protein
MLAPALWLISASTFQRSHAIGQSTHGTRRTVPHSPRPRVVTLPVALSLVSPNGASRPVSWMLVPVSRTVQSGEHPDGFRAAHKAPQRVYAHFGSEKCPQGLDRTCRYGGSQA